MRSVPRLRAYKKVAVFVLPLLLLRALVPVGFMPVPGLGGGFELRLCSGVVDAATFIMAAADPHAQHHHGHGVPPCPYAVGGPAGPAVSLVALPSFVPVEDVPRADAAPSVSLPTILRIQTPRGPPALA